MLGQPKRRHGQFSADFRLMLAKERRAALDLPGAFGKLVRITGKVVATEIRMVDRGQIVPVLGLFVAKTSAWRLDRRCGQAQRLKFFEKLLRFVV